LESNKKSVLVQSDEESPTLYFSNLDQFVQPLKSKGISVVFIGKTFYFALIDSTVEINEKELQEKYKGKVRFLNSLRKEKNLKAIVVTQEGVTQDQVRTDLPNLTIEKL
jgi:hypothetical protein